MKKEIETILTERPHLLGLFQRIENEALKIRIENGSDDYRAFLSIINLRSRELLTSLNNARSGNQSAKKKPKAPNSRENASGIDSSTKNDSLFTLTPADAKKSHFDEFWKIYPINRRVDKPKCKKKFEELPEETQIRAVKQIKSAMTGKTSWTENNFRFCPLTTTYLNQSRWEQVVEQATNTEKQSLMTTKTDDTMTTL